MSVSALPPPDELTAPFWEGGLVGQLRFQRCSDCGHLRFPPSEVCPRCLSASSSWSASTGRGEILTYVVFHRAYHPSWAGQVPYNVVLVQLDDGPRMFSNLVGNGASLEVGARVRATFLRIGDGAALPCFEADGEAGMAPQAGTALQVGAATS